MTVLAINILLEPDGASVQRARAINARLLASHPAGFALDADHVPHITILQRFVAAKDLESVARAAQEVVARELPVNWESMATGLEAYAIDDLGALGIGIQPTDDWRRLQAGLLEAVAPFVVEQGTAAAFAPRLDGAPISQHTIDYVTTFVGPQTGPGFRPHITVGIAPREFREALRAEPFDPFPVRAESVSLYQVGDYGVAQRKLHDLHRC